MDGTSEIYHLRTQNEANGFTFRVRRSERRTRILVDVWTQRGGRIGEESRALELDARDVGTFLDGLLRAVAVVENLPGPRPAPPIFRRSNRQPRALRQREVADRPWPEWEDRALLKARKSGVSVQRLALMHNRATAHVRTRLEVLRRDQRGA